MSGVNEPLVNLSYLSIFITHLLTRPSKNSGILRKLYVDLSLTAAKITEITKGKWSKTNILTALKKHSIKREMVRSKLFYGQKRVRGKILENKYELKIIDLIMEKYAESLSYHVATTPFKKETLRQVSKGLGSLESFSQKLTR